MSAQWSKCRGICSVHSAAPRLQLAQLHWGADCILIMLTRAMLTQVMCELFFQCHYFVYHKHLQPGELPPCKLLPLLTAFPPRLTTATWGMLPQ